MDKQKIPHDWISWDADDHPEFNSSDFSWTLEPEFPLINIGGQAFLHEMKDWLDIEIKEMLLGSGFSEDATANEVDLAGEGRLAGWMRLNDEIGNGQPFHEEIQVAMVQASNSTSPRLSLCDGWHRVAAAIKHKRTTIPAYVGRFRN